MYVMKLGVKELIELCIYCWGHPLLYTFSGSVAVWMLLSGNLQQAVLKDEFAQALSVVHLSVNRWTAPNHIAILSIHGH